ncbi:NADPH-dependent FMN reductase [Oceanobacillus sp. FSL W8-0428]|uniref:NAD(P)H-dependent FMN reductase n=1 Tax=Oceanobacillus sojae TaxID=582851 RepID=A0A511ZJZ0_9BACI|nr:NADPH-dependent FMN reductase [Oceanobacillus sojae]GEN87768.1 NAD(P)H-dependent FMN reductase [Oceanobacillus sojae]
MSEIVVLSGSPSEVSRSNAVLRYIGSTLEEKGFSVTHISVRDVPQDVLFNGEFNSLVIQRITSLIKEAKGVIVGTPVYKSSYSGILKALVDLLPQDVLEDKTVLPLMTGGSSSHLLAMEYTLKPLLASLKGMNLKGVYFVDSQIDKRNTANPIVHTNALERLTKQVEYFTKSISKKQMKILL